MSIKLQVQVNNLEKKVEELTNLVKQLIATEVTPKRKYVRKNQLNGAQSQ